jgi:hypothetical protein
MRRCACPRKESMEGMPKSIIYRHGDRCRKRAYREKVKRAAKAAGVEVAPSLRAIRATRGASGHDGHAGTKPRHAQKRRPEVRLSYRKAVEALVEEFTPKPPEGLAIPESFFEVALLRALSPRARAQVERERAA